MRAAGMLLGGISLLVLGGASVSPESRLWMAPTLLGVVLLFRVAHDLYELDVWLASSSVTALAFSAMGVAALRNLSSHAAEAPWRDEGIPLETRALLFLAVGVAASSIAAWRAVRALRADRERS